MSVSRRSFLGTALAALASIPFLRAESAAEIWNDQFFVGDCVMMKFNRDMIVSAFGVNPYILGVNPLSATINETTVFFESRVKPILDEIVELHVKSVVTEL